MNNILILLNYNDYETTQDFIKNAKKLLAVDKIVVVDNDSKDGSFENLKVLEDEKVHVIRTDKNGGYAYGNNFGAFYAIKTFQPEMISIANPDTVLFEENFNKIFRIFKDKADAGIVSCIMKSSSPIKIMSAWKQPAFFDCCIACLIGIKKIFNWKTMYSKQYYSSSNVIKVDVIAGSFFCIKADVFESINGFDERTFLYCEEAILSSRLKEKGYINYLACDTTYIHKHSVTIDKNIQDVSDRLDILQKSRSYYCKEYLKVGKTGLRFLEFCYSAGKTVYISGLRIKKIMNIFRRF